MAAKRSTGTEGQRKPPLPPKPDSATKAVAEKIRSHIAKITSKLTAPDPLEVRPMQVVSTGFLSLDHNLRNGGLPKGGLHAFEGEPDGGKTLLVAAIVGTWQRLYPDSIHAFLDVEGKSKVQLPMLRTVGLNTNSDRLIRLFPESAEEACMIAMTLLGYAIDEKKGKWVRDPALVPVASLIYDSWAGSPVDTAGAAALARVGSEWWPRIATKASRVGTSIFAINQLRQKPMVNFGDPNYGPGGEAFKFSQSTRMRITRSNVQKDEAKAKIAHDVRVDVQRTKASQPPPPLYLTLNYAQGFDFLADALTYYNLRGISCKEDPSGNIHLFSFQAEDGTTETIREKGREAFLEALRQFPEAAEAFIRQAQDLAARDLAS